MTSEDSDDEPLALIAAAKAKNEDESDEIIDRESDEDYVPAEPTPKKKKVKRNIEKKRGAKRRRNNKNKTILNNALSISLVPTPKPQSRLQIYSEKPVVVERPDVWLFLKDLTRSGPYSCLICSALFVSRLKVIGHYILNHRKIYCGICRYIVANKEAWNTHLQYHSPWTCSQCSSSYPSEQEFHQHLKEEHSQVHCRICYLRMPLGEPYHTHLLKKHNAKNVNSIDEEFLWEVIYPSGAKFRCVICSKINLCSNFLNHYIGYHHFTLRCFGSMVCGRDIPFRVSGANITEEFKRGLNIEGKCGYVGLDSPFSAESKPVGLATEHGIVSDIILKVKQEVVSDSEDVTDCKQDIILEQQGKSIEQILQEVKSYNGNEDFDLTLTEILILHKSCYDYLELCFSNIEAKTVPEISNIAYESVKAVLSKPVECPLCPKHCDTYKEFMNHMDKLHWVKVIKSHVCRICLTPFDSQMELDTHVSEELADFKGLWICQFCDKEFDDRSETRTHMSEHFDELELDNCFSPHLGFKCMNCPYLFWNEPEREEHQIKAHSSKHKEQHYKCECGETFSDKTWFIHHFYARHYNNEMFVFKCRLCTMVLATVDKMRSHFLAEHPEARRMFCCLGNCQYWPLGNEEKLEEHLRSHLPAGHGGIGKKNYKCPVCPLEFGTGRARISHAAQIHGTGKYRCKLCRELLLSRDERKLHYLIRHQGQQPYKCADCGKAFQYKSSLCIHKRNHLPELKKYTCHFCQKSFAKKDSYREHLQIHEGPQYTCSYCPQRFVQRSNMIRHERRHTGERPFQCEHCDRTFADKGACTIHARTHEKERNPFECIYCHATFVQKQKLTYHLRRHTGENLETCEICKKIFTSAYALRIHMKIHDRKDGESVMCPLCKRNYADKRSMMRHLRTTHTNSRIYSCPICSKRLTNAQGLKTHVLTHATTNMFWCKVCPKTYAMKRTMLKHLSRRHRVKGAEDHMRKYYSQLDPRECGLEMDEEGIVSVFGPQKKPIDANIIPFANIPPQDHVENTGEPTSSEGESEKEDTEEENEDEDKKKEASRSSDLEPTDFVSIKIEHMDSDEEFEY